MKVREQTAYEWMVENWERRMEGLTVKEALAEGLAQKCPTCGILHAGIRYMHPDHRQYCGTYCFRNRSNKS